MVEKGLIISSDVIETVDQLGVDANNSPKKLFILKVTDQATDTDGSLPPGSFILIDITGMTHNNFMDLDPAKIYTPVTVNGAPVLMFGALSGIGGEGVGDLSSQFKQVVTQAFYVQWQEDDQGQTKPTIPNSSLRFNQETNRIELVVKVKTDKQEDDVVVAYVDNNTREWMPVETRLVMPDGAILRYEINPAGENVWVIDNQALQVGDQIVEFDLAGNMLTLRASEATQTLTFPSDIVQVEAQDQNIRVTLADGTKQTLTWDQEADRWQEQTLEIYREFNVKELTPENYQKQVDIAIAGGRFMDTEREWEQLKEAGWQVVEDASSHAPVLVSPEASQVINEQYGGNFGASPWAKIFDETRGSRLLDKFKARGDASVVATFDSQGRPILTVSLAEFKSASNKSGTNEIVAVILTQEGKRAYVPQPFESPWGFRRMFVRLNLDANKLVLVDEYETATHEWDDQEKEWVELDEYQVYGTPEERMAYALDYKLNEVRWSDGLKYENLLGLNPEIVAEARQMLKAGKPVEEINQKLMDLYKATQEDDPKSSGIWLAPSADGKPYMVAVVGGRYGLTPEQLTNLKKAVAGLEAVDPGITRFFSEQFGAKFIARKTIFVDVDKRAGTFSSNNYRDTIVAKSVTVKTVADFIIVILAESGEIIAGRHITDGGFAGRFSEYKNVLYGPEFALDWLLAHGQALVDAGVITPKELQDVINLAKYNVEFYKSSP